MMHILVLLFALTWDKSLSVLSDDAMMIADFIKSMERPTSVMATVCWTPKTKLELFLSLTANNVKHFTMMRYFNPNYIPKRHHPDEHILFIVDVNCPTVNQYLKDSSEVSRFRSPFRWLVVGKTIENITDIVLEEIKDIDMLIDAEVTIAYGNDKGFFVLENVYRIGPNSLWRTEYFGTWNSTYGLLVASNMSTPASVRRLNLRGYTIPICYVLTDSDSIHHLTDGIDSHIDTLSKVNFPTTNYLFDFMKAEREYVFVKTWGYLVNGSWSGMTGYMVRGEVEIGGSPMFFTSERIAVVDYITSPTPTRSKFVFLQPKLSYENNLFLLSFKKDVWYSSAALVVILLLTLLTIVYWEGRRFKTDKSRDEDPGILRPNVTDVIMFIYGVACQQGSIVELKGSLGRVVIFILFLTFLFLYTSYSANIVALLQSSSSKIHNLEDLLHSRLKFGVHDTVFNRYYFSTATEPTRKAIYETKVAPKGVLPRFISLEDGVKKLQKGLFAFHMETGVGYKFVGKYFQEGEKCGLNEIQYLQVIDPFLAVRKNTPFKEMFKIGLQRIQEHGLQTRENALLYTKKPKCTGQGGSFVSVSMVDCYPALLVLVYGVVIATVLLFMEILVYRKKETLKSIPILNALILKSEK